MARRRFEQKNNRVDYGELLIESPEYELEQAVGMTYSLDMEALMGIPLCLGMRGEMTSGQRRNPLYVLEAIRRTGKKLSIFCNAGCIKVPQSESSLFALLEDSIHEVRLSKSSYNFHPKLWILQYRNVNDGRRLIKIVVLSRNLTFDQSMDVAVQMTGFVGSEIKQKNQPIADMLTFVSQFDEKKNFYNQIISNVKKVDEFQMLDCFENYEFHPFGIYGNAENNVKKIALKYRKKTAKEMFKNCYSLFVISPFLSENIIRDILDDKNNIDDAGPMRRCLITRETSVTKRIYDAFSKRNGDGVWVVDPVFSSNDALDDGDTFGYTNRDVHAKVFYTEKEKEPHKLYIGSLNASQNAFEHNVEFLLELQYKSHYSSYNSVMDDFIPEKESPFVQLEEFYEGTIDSEEKKVDFGEEVYGIEKAEIIKKDDLYSIKVYSKKAFSNVKIRPFYVKTDLQELKEEIVFHNIPLKSLSNMFILFKEGSECLIRLETTGMPEEERDDAIYNEIISNKPLFMSYMSFLLDEDFYESVSYEELKKIQDTSTNNNLDYGLSIEPNLYERMLRAATEHPERFESMYEVVSRLDNDKIGDEFRELLELFINAAGRKGKIKHDS